MGALDALRNDKGNYRGGGRGDLATEAGVGQLRAGPSVAHHPDLSVCPSDLGIGTLQEKGTCRRGHLRGALRIRKGMQPYRSGSVEGPSWNVTVVGACCYLTALVDPC